MYITSALRADNSRRLNLCTPQQLLTKFTNYSKSSDEGQISIHSKRKYETSEFSVEAKMRYYLNKKT